MSSRWVHVMSILGVLLSANALANGLAIAELQALGDTRIRFRVSWQHAWNLNTAPGNHDAVWLFLKQKEENDWHPVRLAPSGHQAMGPVRLIPAKSGLGVMVAAEQTQEMLSATVELVLAQALAPGTRVKVQGMEMVYVPAGPFTAGDGSSNNTLGHNSAPVTLGQGTNTLTVNNKSVSVPASYPDGVGGFYAMKYEISQAQYASFLDMVSPRQRQRLTDATTATGQVRPAFLTGPNFRNNILIHTETGRVGCNADGDAQWNEPEDGGDRACTFLNWAGLLAYLDWAGLRPMTELEFEKAARGPEVPLPRGFAWGAEWPVNANTPVADGTAAETSLEQASAGQALANYAGAAGTAYLFGPLRVGFAQAAQPDRVSLGISYYGLRDLSGNVWEQTVSVYNSGLAYTGSHGDGRLTEDGQADAPTWPAGADSSAIVRGGAWHSLLLPTAGYPFNDLAISDRFYAGWALHLRRNTVGGRGVWSDE